jgi:hypothetical protein
MLNGGPGGYCPRVQNAFTLKGLQQFFYLRFTARFAARATTLLVALQPLRFAIICSFAVHDELLP